MDNIEDKPGGKREFVHVQGSSSVCFSPDDLILATGDMDGNVQMWDSRRGTCIAKMTGHKGYVNDMQFSPDGKMLATAGEDGTTRVWDVDAKKALHLIKTRHYGVVRGVCFSPDGDLLATAGHNDDTVRLWNVNKNAYSPVKRLKGHTADVFGVRFSSARSNLLASCSADKTVILRDAATFRQTRTFRGHLDGVTCVGFSPVGDVVVSGGIDGTLRIWDAAVTGKAVIVLGDVGQRDVDDACFSPVDSNIVAGCIEGSLCLWDIRKPREYLYIEETLARVTQARFSSDGEELAIVCARDPLVVLTLAFDY